MNKINSISHVRKLIWVIAQVTLSGVTEKIPLVAKARMETIAIKNVSKN